MKLLTLLMICGSALTARSADAKAFLPALAWAESHQQDTARGARGERGRYQMRPVAWQQANRIAGTKVPFSMATNEPASTKQATIYLGWLDTYLTRALCRTPTPAELVAAWQLGPSGFRRAGFNLRRVPASTRRAIERVQQRMNTP